MSENSKKPRIRFSGFVDDWEQRKLGELGATFTGLSGKTKEDFGHGDAEFITYMNVFSNPIAAGDGTESVEIDESQNTVQYGDVLFTTSSETPEEVGMSSVWLDNRVNVYLNSFCFGWRPTVKLDPNYLAFMLRSSAMRKKFTFLAQGISRYNISKNKVMEMSVPVPTAEEQRSVGVFFANLDSLITIHQQKYDKAVNIKKAMLEKMFPKDGADRPEIRFAGFTDAWEQRKLYEVAEFNPKTALPDVFQYVDLESVLGTELIANRTELRESAPSRAQRLAERGDIFYQTVRPYQKNNYLFDLPHNDYVFSTGYAQMRPSIDGRFLFSKLQEERFVKTVLDRCTGTSYPAINATDLSEIEIGVPRDRAEQTQIGLLFAALSDLLTLHQRKLEKLRNLKKAFLEKMFVSI